jgi:hypothetical protein
LRTKIPEIGDDLISLQPVDTGNVEVLVTWTLDPVAQGPYKRVPALTREELRELFLNDPEREYFLIRHSGDARPLGRFYWRARQNTRSVFAFTLISNEAERRALLKAGFREEGRLPSPRYPVVLPKEPCVLFVWPSVERTAQHGAGAGGAGGHVGAAAQRRTLARHA